MGTMIMNMSRGNIERDESVTTEYTEEVLCSGWNPVVAMTQLVPEDKHKSFPAELAGVDLELFLHQMYG
jgi:hypothetical protein